MAYTPENNPYIPGDPYSYDLKWQVDHINMLQGRVDNLDSAIQEATDQADRSEREADRSKEEADRASQNAKMSEVFSDYSYRQGLKSEGYATGQQNGEYVEPGSPYYENNSKYYSQRSAASAQDAADYAAHIADPVSGIVTTWLDANVDPDTGYVIDKSLTISDAAADAKITGEGIGNFMLNQLGDTGNFVDAGDWYTSGATAYSVSSNVASFTPTAQYGSIYSTNTVSLIKDHVYYSYCKIKGYQVAINFEGRGSNERVTDTSNFVFYSFIYTGDGNAYHVTAFTFSTTLLPVEIKECGVIDLTEVFGADIPDKATLDTMVSQEGFFIRYPLGKYIGNHFTEITTLENNVETVTDLVGNFMENTLGSIGSFDPVNTWYVSNAASYSVLDGTAQFTPTAQWGGIKTTSKITIEAGHIYYVYGKLKGDKVGFSFDGYGGGNYITPDDFTFHSWFYSDSGSSRRLCVCTASNVLDPVYAKEIGIIDMTATFGDNMPSIEQMDILVQNAGSFIEYEYGEFLKNSFAIFENSASEYVDLRNKTIVIIGDSISETNYIVDGELSPHKTNWSSFAAPLLNNPTIYNIAQDGSSYHEHPGAGTYQTFKGQYDFMVSKGYDPDIIIVMLGTNDWQWPATDNYNDAMAIADKASLDKNNLYQCIRYAYWLLTENYPTAQIIIVTPIQRANFSVYSNVRTAILEMAGAYCGNVVDASTGSGIISQYEIVNDNGRYLRDGLHPNEAGKKLLGTYMAAEITHIIKPNKQA